MSDQVCPDIGGSYYSQSVTTTSGERRVSLLAYVHPDRWYTLLNDLSFADRCVQFDHLDGERIAISYPEGGEERILAELSLEAGDYSCVDGVLWITTDWIPEIHSMYGAGAHARRLGLSTAIDGSLVGESHENYGGVVMLVIPVASKDRQFHRWGACD